MTPSLNWTERGRELAASLDLRHAVVIVGSDPVATSDVALGIAREQARHRRVSVGDLFGDAPPLRDLVTTEDPHGVMDSFLFGVSLKRIEHAVPDWHDVFIMLSGTAPLDHEELLTDPRWRRIAAGFAERNALLLLVAPVGAARLRDLVDVMDGVVIVGEQAPPEISVAQALAWLRPPRRTTQSVAAEAPLAVVEAARAKPRRAQRRLAMAAGLVLTLGLAGAGLWFAYRPFASAPRPQRGEKPGASPLAHQLAIDPVADRRVDSMRKDSMATVAAILPPVDASLLIAPANRADSAAAAGWAVQLEQTNTKAGAILDLRLRFETVPAGTYGFDLRTRFFMLVAGAYPTRAGAESLLVQLRAHRILAPGIGSVTSMPLAFLVQAEVPAIDVPSRLSRFAGRGQPVYALRQKNGTANLYFGAYESAQQAALALPIIHEAGLTPTLVYRIGRVF